MVTLRDHEDGCLVTVFVVAGASRDEIVGVHGDALRIRVTPQPERGRATSGRAAEALSAPVELARGTTSRTKVFLVRGRSREQVDATAALSRG